MRRRLHAEIASGWESGTSSSRRSVAGERENVGREDLARSAAGKVGIEQLLLELGELAVGRERGPRARAIARTPR